MSRQRSLVLEYDLAHSLVARVLQFLSHLSFCCLPGLQRFESIENAIGTRIDTNGRYVAPTNDAIGIDDEKCSISEAVVLAINTIRTTHSPFCLQLTHPRQVKTPFLAQTPLSTTAITP